MISINEIIAIAYRNTIVNGGYSNVNNNLKFSVDVQGERYIVLIPGLGYPGGACEGRGASVDDAIRNAYNRYLEYNKKALSKNIKEYQDSIRVLEEKLKHSHEQLQITINKLAIIEQEHGATNVETNETR